MGGTEILGPIREVIKNKSDRPCYVFLITDGDVTNSNEIIATVHEKNEKMRFFSIGIGNGISPYLIQNIAKAGRGDYDFVKDDENIEEKT